MYEWDIGGEQCENVVANGSQFCEVHQDTRLCKTSGIQYQSRGNSVGWCVFIQTVHNHPVDALAQTIPTKRKQFCSDRCRNLWRDTKQSRERQSEVEKLVSGERSERYASIRNYRNSGEDVVLDKKTNRISWAGSVEL
jgi:hypothetical protein